MANLCLCGRTIPPPHVYPAGYCTDAQFMTLCSASGQPLKCNPELWRASSKKLLNSGFSVSSMRAAEGVVIRSVAYLVKKPREDADVAPA